MNSLPKFFGAKLWAQSDQSVSVTAVSHGRGPFMVHPWYSASDRATAGAAGEHGEAASERQGEFFQGMVTSQGA